ncbi:hypothetical protein Q8F55_001626 [Vanrija albida]|uniref:Uncharacterized protein n=1 Tax=Vanrija albida TaxID=181172 RepID=A0ABR3QH72_9TREE
MGGDTSSGHDSSTIELTDLQTSKVTPWWLHRLLRTGFQRPLESTDLWNLDPSRQSGPLAARLLENIDKRQQQAQAINDKLPTTTPPIFRKVQWAYRAATHTKLSGDYEQFGPDTTIGQRFHTMSNEWKQRSGKRGGGTALGWALLDTFPSLWVAVPYKALVDASGMVTPLLTKAIIRFSQQEYAAKHGTGEKPNMGHGIAMAIGLFLLFLFHTIMQGQFTFIVTHDGILAKAATSQALYSTAFKHTVASRSQHPTGKLVTHMSADLGRVAMSARSVIQLIVTPFTLVAGLVLLCLQIGVSGIIGFIVIVVAAPITSWLTKRTFEQRQKSTEFTQQRSKLLQELLASMATVKVFTYELPFLSRLDKLRRSEMNGVRNINFLRSLTESIFESLPLLGSIFAFIMYSALHPQMDIANLFTAVTYFGLLQGPLFTIPSALAALTDLANALQRLAPVFEAEQRIDGVLIDGTLEVAIRVQHASFRWEGTESETKAPKGDAPASAFSIRDLNLEVPRGRLAAIIGPVGSGKSSILQGILGEMTSVDPRGEVKFGGRTAYCQQTAWIRNATLRDNIVFGRPWDEARYWKVIRQANMTRDLEILRDGDQTEIGEKGINLSGGQKQRVNIARALYYDADILVSGIFENPADPQLLDDPLSALDAHVGMAVFNDAILSLREAGKTVLLVTHGLHLLPRVDYIYSVADGRILEEGTYGDLLSSPSFKSLVDAFGGNHEDDSTHEVESKPRQPAPSETTGKGTGSGDGKGTLTTAEKRVTGAVGPYVYWAYMVAGNLSWLGPLVIMIILMEGSQIMSNVWLTYWERNKFHRLPPFYQGLYAMLGVFSASFNGLTGVSLALMSANASRTLYSKALKHVFFSPMSYFDTTPLGRIQGVFSTDISAIDNMVPAAMRYTISTLAGLIGAIIVISIQFPYYVAIVAFVTSLYGLVVYYYRPYARESQRLDAINRGLLFSHFSESLAGLPTIRAYGETDRFISENSKLVDLQNRATLANSAGKTWLTVRLEMAGSLLIFAVGLMCTAAGGSINPGLIALVLNYVVATTVQLSTLAQAGTLLETSLNSVERILPYSDCGIPQEALYEIKETDPGSQWPVQGAIRMDKLVMAYRPGQPIVLKGVSLDIEPGQRVGIVGRTGAGKSSLTIALYRLTELLSGSISIDGVDVSKIGLKKLRSNLAIIPQDPVLFSGTLRSNLDPFDDYSDAVLNEALQRAHLVKGPSSGTPRFTLDMAIDTEGSNLSIGERSLVSLARALVRDSKIMVLDEATASVDLETDAAIQLAIREECRRSRKTLLCIAHRLRTIIGWDKIVVMEAGEVVDFASPLELFDDHAGIFRSLCDESRISRDEIVRAGKTEAL